MAVQMLTDHANLNVTMMYLDQIAPKTDQDPKAQDIPSIG
jgi:hypothetical protein